MAFVRTHVPAWSDALTGRLAGHVWSWHGFGGTPDCGLLAHAEGIRRGRYRRASFDHRGFGDSDGHPRQDISPPPAQDYHAALAAARHLPGVDAGLNRVVGLFVCRRSRHRSGRTEPTGCCDRFAQSSHRRSRPRSRTSRVSAPGAAQLARLTAHGLPTSANWPAAIRTHLPAVGEQEPQPGHQPRRRTGISASRSRADLAQRSRRPYCTRSRVQLAHHVRGPPGLPDADAGGHRRRRRTAGSRASRRQEGWLSGATVRVLPSATSRRSTAAHGNSGAR